MSKLINRDGKIVLASNGIEAVRLDEEGLHVILPEGEALGVMVADSGLSLSFTHSNEKLFGVVAERTSPRPEFSVPAADLCFTCPRCGSHKFGSWGTAGSLRRCCHGLDGDCRFGFHESDDHLYFKEFERS